MKCQAMKPKKLLAGVLSATVVVAAVALLWSRSKKLDPRKRDCTGSIISLKCLREAAGELGKVVSVGDPGHGGLSYTCTSQDAAVAWIKITDPGRPEYTGFPQALVSKGERFSVISHPFGTYCALALQRGYSSAPSKLDL